MELRLRYTDMPNLTEYLPQDLFSLEQSLIDKAKKTYSFREQSEIRIQKTPATIQIDTDLDLCYLNLTLSVIVNEINVQNIYLKAFFNIIGFSDDIRLH